MALQTGGEAGGKVSPARDYELTRTSGWLRASHPCIDVPVDTAGPYCQRNHDSTPHFLSYFVQILHFVRFTNANKSF